MVPYSKPGSGSFEMRTNQRIGECGYLLRRVACFIVVFLLLDCSGLTGRALGNGSTDSLGEYVRQFESSYHAVRTIRADFTQTYVSGGRTRIESGIVYFARAGLMRWDYQRPQPKLFLSDGKTLMLYIPEEK